MKKIGVFIGVLFLCLAILSPLISPCAADGNGFEITPRKKIPVLSESETAVIARQYHEVPVTQWVDYGGLKPTSFAEWSARVGPRSPFAIKQVTGTDSHRNGVNICVIVNSGLYNDIAASLDQYILDLTAEGHTVEIHLSTGGTHEDMRGFLQGKYAEGMEGCLLIGDMPIPWYKTECWDPVTHEEFPCDLYYMDLDGTFIDNDADGLYDEHTGNFYPEIWVGRLTASPMYMGGMTEAQLLNNYFVKNHLYRTGGMTITSRGLSYIDDDWIPWDDTWNANHGLAYGDRTLISDGAMTIDADYEGRLLDNYESILLCAHSSPATHQFKIGDLWTGGYTTNSEVRGIDPEAIFYNLFACSNARFVEYDYMGGWYIFAQTYGLVAIGSTKTGSMLSFDYFYNPFGNCATIGEAFRDWFTVISVGGFSHDEICWHYGMTLLGDPTLRAYALQPLEIAPETVPLGEFEIPYSATITASGGLPPYDFEMTAGNLPLGLSFDPASGEVSGIPEEFGDFSFTITVSDGCSYTQFTDDAEYSLAIAPHCGDIESDGLINILDIVYLINYIYKSGPEPKPMNNADVDGDSEINILDIVYLINFIYKNGPELCPYRTG